MLSSRPSGRRLPTPCGCGTGWLAWQPPLVLSPALTKARKAIKSKMLKFYSVHNPEKGKEFERGEHNDLLQNMPLKDLNEGLMEKYGQDLASFDYHQL